MSEWECTYCGRPDFLLIFVLFGLTHATCEDKKDNKGGDEDPYCSPWDEVGPFTEHVLKSPLHKLLTTLAHFKIEYNQPESRDEIEQA